MIERILDLSQTPARLKVRLDQLIIQRDDAPEQSVPLEDIASLVVSNRGVIYSNAVLTGLAEKGGTLIACDERFQPVAMLLPLAANSLQSQRFAAQAAAALPTHKRLWQTLVRAKINAQADLLTRRRGSDFGLKALADNVKSGDKDNCEAQAARRYWPALFDDPSFRRDRDRAGVNTLLNYGYGVLRGLVVRSICGAGLHPTLGLRHHHRENPFCLADDLMEPFRPLVDDAVAPFAAEEGEPTLDKETKSRLLGPLLGRMELKGEQRTLFDVLARLSASLAQVYLGRRKSLVLPGEIRLSGGTAPPAT